jgi:hypothetical protein
LSPSLGQSSSYYWYTISPDVDAYEEDSLLIA